MEMFRTYPEGVTSWVDVEHADLEAAREFYSRLFGWNYIEAVGADGAVPYVIAQLGGQAVAGLGRSDERSTGWSTYVAADDVDRVAARVEAAGGRVVLLSEVGDAARIAWCEDPSGVPFRLWEATRQPGAQLANSPGAWNFSDLHAADTAAAAAFYGEVFGWEFDDVGFGAMIRRPGYGNHLAATVDPGIRERQAEVQAPPGFADAIGWLAPAAPDERTHWHVTFTVADRDASVATVERIGGTVLDTEDTEWTRHARVRDPQGATFTVSQFTPQAG
ncbi:hypothetical protein CLV30_11153 [Haloactinopolyspora alba]|uniref:VOC domain-containing protein n=1 Tax=Haloactinopolyspora alba TaxID=648780 RepID=A0A2P8DY00_9ACTN|nr:VOC family protein [Haloactinopolyspora alba]PSL02098.1 hypothetical protein CLV30_11153 [Haloactinopolyspora alba]